MRVIVLSTFSEDDYFIYSVELLYDCPRVAPHGLNYGAVIDEAVEGYGLDGEVRARVHLGREEGGEKRGVRGCSYKVVRLCCEEVAKR